MASAVTKLAEVFANTSGSPAEYPCSPERRQTAIRQLRKDALLTTPTQRRRVRFIRHFQSNTAAADAYTELQEDDELRAVWLMEEEEFLRRQ